ncbi:MAG: hypothetical protein AAGA38_16180 [Pseudomonadota bacterium]
MRETPKRKAFGLCLSLFIACSVGQAWSDVFCVGTDPEFRLHSSGEETRFDYLGVEVFELLPPIDETDIQRSARTSVMLNATKRIPVRLEPRTCEFQQTLLPIRIEINVPGKNGETVLRGCCLTR